MIIALTASSSVAAPIPPRHVESTSDEPNKGLWEKALDTLNIPPRYREKAAWGATGFFGGTSAGLLYSLSKHLLRGKNTQAEMLSPEDLAKREGLLHWREGFPEQLAKYKADKEAHSRKGFTTPGPLPLVLHIRKRPEVARPQSTSWLQDVTLGDVAPDTVAKKQVEKCMDRFIQAQHDGSFDLASIYEGCRLSVAPRDPELRPIREIWDDRLAVEEGKRNKNSEAGNEGGTNANQFKVEKLVEETYTGLKNARLPSMDKLKMPVTPPLKAVPKTWWLKPV
ncbi:MAG: DnaJ- protein scj1 [Watsoniomyces obsoletus]|nr:MAG: DnaJ- protein scj1 [Watsoniomyces obsoletus]